MSLLPTNEDKLNQLEYYKQQCANKDIWINNITESLNECIKTMQDIKLVCQRAKSHYIEESDIDEILELLKGKI